MNPSITSPTYKKKSGITSSAQKNPTAWFQIFNCQIVKNIIIQLMIENSVIVVWICIVLQIIRKDICWLLFTLNDINLTTLQIYNHYNTIDLGVVRLAANYSIFRNFLYFWPRYHEIGVLCYYNYNCGSYWTEEWFNKYLVNILHLSLYDTGADCGVRQPDICQRSCLP